MHFLKYSFSNTLHLSKNEYSCKLLYIAWINNKVLLYSTGNYIQYPVINHNGKNMKKNLYIYVPESLCCVAECTTTL